jgi:hypothetical protein
MVKTAKAKTTSKATSDSDSLSWQPADKDYSLALVDGKLVCRNPKGKTLATLPPWLKESETAQQLMALSEWLDEHALECLLTVERWMLRSLSVPREVLHQIWPDPDWRKVVENLVVAPANTKGESDLEQMGLLKDVDDKKGLGIVDVDGESQWLKQPLVIFPHLSCLPLPMRRDRFSLGFRGWGDILTMESQSVARDIDELWSTTHIRTGMDHVIPVFERGVGR